MPLPIHADNPNMQQGQLHNWYDHSMVLRHRVLVQLHA